MGFSSPFQFFATLLSSTIKGIKGDFNSGNAGSDLTITGGDADTATGNGNGGNLKLTAGAKNGSGTNGAVQIGATNTASVSLGAASIPTNIVGPLGTSVGASTAAAGTTSANAGALPAGTSSNYPVTAADGTKGVIINAADKVTGREIFIGNKAAAILKVYPPTGGNINGLGVDAAFSTASQKGALLICEDSAGNTWFAA